MIYSDYKDAAERHLEVCLQLLHDIEENYKNKEPLTSRQEKEKKQLLADLYYLSGYIIECSYCCAIYKNLGWSNDVKDLRYSDTTYSVSTKPNANASFVIRRAGSGVRQHQLSGNMHFFQTIIPTSNLSSVPIIGANIPVAHPAFDLFENWNAEIRYLIDSSVALDYVGVFAFFYLANEIYEGLLTNSMI